MNTITEPSFLEKSAPAQERDGLPVDHDSLHLYFQEIGKTPLLTLEEETKLASQIRRGDRAARNHMIQANLRLVVKIAMDYRDFGLPLLDLISEGNIGLIKAVERFDPNKGGEIEHLCGLVDQAIDPARIGQSGQDHTLAGSRCG